MPRKKKTETTNTENTGTEVAQKRPVYPRPNRSKALLPQTKAGELSKMLQNAMEIASFGPVDSNSPEEVENRIGEYFRYCMEKEIRPSAEGMALALNTSRMSVWQWREGVVKKPEGVRAALKKGFSVLNYILAQYMQDGKINPVAGIFLLKNNYAYTDQSEVIVTPNTGLDALDPAAARQKYLDTLPEAEALTETTDDINV